MIDLTWSDDRMRQHIQALRFWRGAVDLQPLVGGLCNKSFIAQDQAGKYVVRVGGDIWVHGISQSSVQNAMRAATEIGVTAALRYSEPGLVISDFIEGRHLRPDDMHNEAVLEKLVARVRQLHAGSAAICGSLIYFWPFQVVRHYVRYCLERKSRLGDELDALAAQSSTLERLVAPFQAVFTHNDVVPQNAMIDAGGEVFLIDWDYGAYGHPFFDLAGIATNADADDDVEARVLELYAGRVDGDRWHQFRLFKLIINLREFLWGAVQEVASDLDPAAVQAGMAEVYPGQSQGYEGYTEMNRKRFYDNLAVFKKLYG